MSDKEKLEPKQDSQYDERMRLLQLKKAEAELQDIEERLAEREMKRENKRQRSNTNGQTIKQINSQYEIAQRRCNHKKGGNGAEGIIGGQGDDPQYAVLKHRMANGDVWVRCLRCGKTWKPPVLSDFTMKSGEINRDSLEIARKEYLEAVAFQTRNVPSGSITFGFSDGGEYYREVTKNSNLR